MDRLKHMHSRIDTRKGIRQFYEKQVASKNTVLDIGGRNHSSRSYARLRNLSLNPNAKITSTDIYDDYNPDIVDDICNSKIKSNSYDAVYCDAILEHVQDYNSAFNHMHRILKPDGELFVFVPFFWCFHDRADYHRFTVSELNRLLSVFSKYKIFLPDSNGYGGVLWQVLTFYKITKYSKTHSLLSKLTNGTMTVYFSLKYLKQKIKNGPMEVTLKQFLFFNIHLCVNSGFCGWAVKEK